MGIWDRIYDKRNSYENMGPYNIYMTREAHMGIMGQYIYIYDMRSPYGNIEQDI